MSTAAAYSRYTDPGPFAAMLDELPGDPSAIAAVARAQTVHHNLLPHFGIPRQVWASMARVHPPRVAGVLNALSEREPHTLSLERPPEQRVIGACVLESHLLAGLLRHRGLRVRIRAGYFKDIRGDREHVVAFWENVMRAKGVQADLLARDPDRWRETVNAYTEGKNAVDHHIEHWICEVWDDPSRGWRLLDANDEFLRAHSGLDVGFFLPREYFEYAHEAWLRIRSGDSDPEQYREEERDGRSHVRSQMLSDFASLLNHDVAGIDTPGRDDEFVRRQTYDETSAAELSALDRLAAVLARGDTAELAAFYRETPELRLEGAEEDPYCVVCART